MTETARNANLTRLTDELDVPNSSNRALLPRPPKIKNLSSLPSQKPTPVRAHHHKNVTPPEIRDACNITIASIPRLIDSPIPECPGMSPNVPFLKLQFERMSSGEIKVLIMARIAHGTVVAYIDVG